LIAIPAILGALILQFGEAGNLLEVVDPLTLLVGLAASFVTGLLSLILLLRVVRKGQLAVFSIYLVPLSVISFILL
jgi:undecaprenyl-diphosphatase